MLPQIERFGPEDSAILNATLVSNFARLAAIPIEDQRKIISQTDLNPDTGIKIAQRIVPSHFVGSVEYLINLAEVPAGGSVRVHVHDLQNDPPKGFDVETYSITDGIGIIHTGIERGSYLEMNPPFIVIPGTKITIPAETVHELRGITKKDIPFIQEQQNLFGNSELQVDPDEPVLFTFSCPESHITSGPGSNRRFVDEVPRTYLAKRILGTVFVEYPSKI